MKDSSIIERIHSKYAQQVGSEQIATKLALEIVASHIKSTKPQSILEIGSGIGTITELILELLPDTKLYCYEINDWCSDQLKTNLDPEKFTLIPTQDSLASFDRDVQFVVVDDWIDKETTLALIRRLRPSSVFIEGHRRTQRLYFMQAFRHLNIPFAFENFRSSESSHKGGCLITVSRTSSLLQYKLLVFVYFSLVYSKITEIRSRIPLRKIKSKILNGF